MVRRKKERVPEWLFRSSFIRCSRKEKWNREGAEGADIYLWLWYFISLRFSQCRAFSSQSPRSSLTDSSLFVAFRDLRPVSLEKGQETLRLRVYACYAWGGPFLVAGLAALLDHLPPQPQYTFLRPRFGEKQCWFYGKFLPRPSSLLRELSYRRVKTPLPSTVTLLVFAANY